MRPELFEIGGFAIYSYGVMIAIAFLIGIFYAMRQAPKENIKEDHIFEVLILVIVLAAFGSRLVFVVRNFEFYRDEFLWGMLAFRDGGLVFHGGFIFAALGVFLFSYFRNYPFFKLMDLGAMIVAIGYPIARIGCFLNGCCYGSPSDLPWAVVYPVVDDISRHPTQLYSSLLMAGVLILMLYLRKIKYFEGFLLSWFLLLYGIYRFVIEFFRINPPAVGGLTEPQLVAIAFIVIGTGVLLIQRKRYSTRKI